MWMSSGRASLVESRDSICAFCLCMEFGNFCVAKALTVPLSNVSDAMLIGTNAFWFGQRKLFLLKEKIQCVKRW